MKSFQSGRATSKKNLSIECGFPSGTRLMGILRIQGNLPFTTFPHWIKPTCSSNENQGKMTSFLTSKCFACKVKGKFIENWLWKVMLTVICMYMYISYRIVVAYSSGNVEPINLRYVIEPGGLINQGIEKLQKMVNTNLVIMVPLREIYFSKLFSIPISHGRLLKRMCLGFY